MKKPTNNWNIEPFLKWWEKEQDRFHCGHFDDQQIAYSAWEAGIDYYINNREGLLPFDLKQCKHCRVKKGGEWSRYGHYDVYYKCLDCNRIFYQDETSTDIWNALKEKETKNDL
jgi:hypothetical protein